MLPGRGSEKSEFSTWHTDYGLTDPQEEAKVNLAEMRSEHKVSTPDDDRLADLQQLLREYRSSSRGKWSGTVVENTNFVQIWLCVT